MRYDFGTPSFVVDISPVVDRKAAAIAAYASQLGQRTTTTPPAVPAAGSPTPLIASPLTLEAFSARDRYLGAFIGVLAGEAYLTRSVMGLSDPVAHFRDHRFGNPLFFPTFFGPPK
jgi:hypothetical protein